MRLQSDERLAELAIDGHEAAFAAIVDRYRTPLLRYCAGIVGAGRAEDAVQQVLINAHDALNRTSDVRHLRSWLYRIAHNTSLNVLRAVRDDVPLDARHAALTAGPADALERSERLRETLDAVRELPERQRAALVLRELEGRSHEEIATALGVTTGSARQHLMRARTAVRGAVTAITPYPLIARLADLATSPSAGSSAGSWGEAAVGAGAGAGATVVKLTAGVLATGALAGGAVGTNAVVHHGDRHGQALSRQTTERAPAPAAAATENAAALRLPAGWANRTAGGSKVLGPRQRDGSSTGTRDDHRGTAGDDGPGNGDTGAGPRSGTSGRGSPGDAAGRGRSGDGSRGEPGEAGSSGKSTSGKGTSGSSKRGGGKGNSGRGADKARRGKDDGKRASSVSERSGRNGGAALTAGGTPTSEDLKDSGDGTPSTGTTVGGDGLAPAPSGSSSGSGASLGSGSSAVSGDATEATIP
jgi:RNA polymerase sigma factor (sigma-70 family)